MRKLAGFRGSSSERLDYHTTVMCITSRWRCERPLPGARAPAGHPGRAPVSALQAVLAPEHQQVTQASHFWPKVNFLSAVEPQYGTGRILRIGVVESPLREESGTTVPGRQAREGSTWPLNTLRWLTVLLTLVDFLWVVSGSVDSGDHLSVLAAPASWTDLILSCASRIVAPWRFRAGLALGIVPIVRQATLGTSFGAEALMELVIIAGYQRDRLPALLLAAPSLVFLIRLRQEGDLVGVAPAILVFTLGYLLPLGIGATARFLMERHRSMARTLTDLERQVEQVRAAERAALARELARALNADLRANTRHLQQALDLEGPSARQALAEVERTIRRSFTSLHELVSVLRETDDAPLDPVTAQIERIEDHLTQYGYTVEIEGTAPAGLTPQEATVLSRALDLCRDRAMANAPSLATCHLRLSPTGLEWRHRTGPEQNATDDEPSARALEDLAARADARICQYTADGRWSLVADLAPARGPESAPSAGTHSAAQPRVPWFAALTGRLATRVPSLVRTPVGAVYLASTLGLAGLMVRLSVTMVGDVGLRLIFALTGLAFFACFLAPFVPRCAIWILAGSLVACVVLRLPYSFWGPQMAVLALTAMVTLRDNRFGSLMAPVWMVAGLAWMRTDAVWFVILFYFPAYPLMGYTLGVVLRWFVRDCQEQEEARTRLTAQHSDAIQSERRRLAGELHDVLAHQLAVIAMRISTYRRTVGAPDPTEEQRFLADLTAMNTRAIAELEVLVAAMRQGGDPRFEAGGALSGGAETDDSTACDPGTGSVGPTETARIVALALRDAGHHVTVDVDPAVDDLDPFARHTLVRTLRESGTNVLRYARPRSTCEILVRQTPEGTEVRVVSDLAASTPPAPDSTGQGLLGLAERARLTGATFSAGPESARWVVRVLLPPGV